MDSSYEELEQVFHPFPKYHMKILLRDFNTKIGKEDIFKPRVGKDSLNENSDDNGVKSSKLCQVKNIWFLRAQSAHIVPLMNIHSTSPDEKMHSEINRSLIYSR
jgi:hypothetical protein